MPYAMGNVCIVCRKVMLELGGSIYGMPPGPIMRSDSACTSFCSACIRRIRSICSEVRVGFVPGNGIGGGSGVTVIPSGGRLITGELAGPSGGVYVSLRKRGALVCAAAEVRFILG